MGKLLYKNSQSVGLKLPKCGETHITNPLFISVSGKVIEHITDDAYNRQGNLGNKSPIFTLKREKQQGKDKAKLSKAKPLGRGGRCGY